MASVLNSVVSITYVTMLSWALNASPEANETRRRRRRK